MKNIYIVHGWGGSPEEGWFPWAKQKLEKQGNKVTILEMPNPDAPAIKEWVSFLDKKIISTEEVILVGHSIGCQTILRYLETLSQDVSIKAVICVAGWFTLNKLKTQEEEEIAHAWLNTPINFEKVKKHAQSFYYIYSDNDPYVPIENASLFKEKLGAKIIELNNYGHIGGEDNVRELPTVIEVIKEIETNK